MPFGTGFGASGLGEPWGYSSPGNAARDGKGAITVLGSEAKDVIANIGVTR